MNFLDSFLEKIPIIRDMDKKKRILAAGFLLFAIISLIGILVDAIAEAGGVVALLSVAIGFLLMAALIIADFIMSRKSKPDYGSGQDQYNFYDDNPDDYGYQDESVGYGDNDGFGDNYDSADFADEMTEDNSYRDDGNYQDDYGYQDDNGYRDDRGYQDDNGYRDDRGYQDDGDFGDGEDYRNNDIEYTVTPEPTSSRVTPDAYDARDTRNERERNRRPVPSRFEFRPAAPQNTGRAPVLYDENVIGKPVMMFDAPSQSVSDEVGFTADAVAPQVVRPEPADTIGGPVMSIPFRGNATETAPEPQKVVLAKTENVEPVKPQPAQSLYEARLAAKREERGQEIEEFFDHMSDDEILYSDCVEVWAADAKPAAIRLLKQVESISDKKMLRRFAPFFMEKRIGLLWKGLDIDIVTDKRWLIFALTQVVFNAVEFTGLGGKIAISAKKEGSMIHLMVDDSGCGISDEDLPHIFMAGFMGDNVPNESGHRTGMGLFITRSVTEKLGGSVTAESTVGKGTRITMILPERI